MHRPFGIPDPPSRFAGARRWLGRSREFGGATDSSLQPPASSRVSIVLRRPPPRCAAHARYPLPVHAAGNAGGVADALGRAPASQIRVALGLWPCRAHAVESMRARRRRARGLRRGRVAIESVPGHFVTGNVYRPTGRTGRLPAVLSPHGHWPGGRFQDVDDKDARRPIACRRRADSRSRPITSCRPGPCTSRGIGRHRVPRTISRATRTARQLGLAAVCTSCGSRARQMEKRDTLGLLQSAGGAPPAERHRACRRGTPIARSTTSRAATTWTRRVSASPARAAAARRR